MKDISTPVPPNEVRAVIKKSLENAALVNYERLSEEARLEGEKEIRTFESRCQDLSIDVKNGFFFCIRKSNHFQKLNVVIINFLTGKMLHNRPPSN